ncbi:hypothetical protein BC829DRAFT_380217 [Chytridium lagenaria]|nr:hypothetical protein BC829DRAFT_380217 [Chytridium lagenaria]
MGSKMMLPGEILSRIVYFCPDDSLRMLLSVSRTFFSIAAAEWDSRLPRLDPQTILHGTSLYPTSASSWGKINVYARVVKLGARTYSTSMAQIEFLGKRVTGMEPRSGGLVSLRELPETLKQGIKTSLGRRIWLHRIPASGGGGVEVFLFTISPQQSSSSHNKLI